MGGVGCMQRVLSGEHFPPVFAFYFDEGKRAEDLTRGTQRGENRPWKLARVRFAPLARFTRGVFRKLDYWLSEPFH
jgi:hypothetical protein